MALLCIVICELQDSMLVTAALCLLCECCCLLFRMACSQCGPALPEWPLGTSKRAIVLKFIPKDRMKMDFDLQPAARYYLVRRRNCLHMYCTLIFEHSIFPVKVNVNGNILFNNVFFFHVHIYALFFFLREN